MVERITITIGKPLLERIDKMVDKKNIKNRSHAIETLLHRSLSKTDITTAIIMAGGKGTKLRPITYEIPKALIPIHGRPVLEHQINLLKKFDIRNIVVSLSEQHEKVREYFGNGSKFGVNIEYIVEKKPLGPLGALSLARDYIKNTFIVMNGDTLMNLNIAEIYDFHKKEGKLATIVLRTGEKTETFGVVRLSGNDVLEFVEKPSSKAAPSRHINIGFYIMEPDVLKHLHKAKVMTDDLFSRLAKLKQVSGYVHDYETYDVSTPEGFERAIKSWKIPVA